VNPILENAIASASARVAHRGERNIATLGKLDMHFVPDRLTFAAEEAFVRQGATDPGIAGIIVPPALASACANERIDWWVFEHQRPLAAFWQIHLELVRADFYAGRRGAPQVDPSANVSTHAIIEEGVVIGADCTIEPFAVLKSGTSLGRNVRIGSHSVLGRDGFERIEVQGRSVHVPHTGGVTIEDDVEIHAGSHIDRALWGETRIGGGTQIDNLCHVGHACRLGRDNLLAAGTILGGVLKVGDANFFGMNCTVKQNLTIGSRCRIAMGAVVLNDLPDDTKLIVVGSMTDREYLTSLRSRRP
jgi:acyl-[acyl carrier protein]--UDP-N-acetylglucosamine O-acyltransferase